MDRSLPCLFSGGCACLIHRTLVLHMLQNKSLAVLNATILESRLYEYKLNAILLL